MTKLSPRRGIESKFSDHCPAALYPSLEGMMTEHLRRIEEEIRRQEALALVKRTEYWLHRMLNTSDTNKIFTDMYLDLSQPLKEYREKEENNDA